MQYKGREKEYKSEYWKKYYEENKHEIGIRNRSRLKEKRESDPDWRNRKNEYAKEYYQQNKDKFNIRTPEDVERRNNRRRELYAENEQYRERAKLQARESAKRNPETRIKNLLGKNYGITIEQYNNILEQQNGGCAICGSKSALIKSHQRLHVDHCHSTGRVRGLLCTNCNQGIGKFNDSEVLLQRAIVYLMRETPPEDSRQ